MATIRYINHDGTEHSVAVDNGLSLMDGARSANIPGIEAECGGACACATCHVYIDEAWQATIGAPSEMEQSMLDFATDLEVGSRLSCQVKIDNQLEGMIVRIPKSQR